VILIPKGAVARGKLAQVLAAGAELREVEGTFDGGARARPRLAGEEGW
jgi:threonine synthase